MIDPTAPAALDDLPAWSSTDAVDLCFARRAAEYLRNRGVEPDAVAAALRAELDLSTSDAAALSGGRPPRPTQNLQLISH